MELRQLKYFVRVVALRSMGRAALELDLATSTLSQQISQLEGELSTRLLQRKSTGVEPTDAGLDFFHQAQLILRQCEAAASIAQKGRLSGHVSVGLAGTTAAMLAVPFVRAMRERYPGVRVRIVEGLSGHLEGLLNSRQLDLAILFDADAARRWSLIPLLDERLFLIARPDLPGLPAQDEAPVQALAGLPLILPGGSHTLRTLVFDAWRQAGATPDVVVEIDGVASLMDAVRAGLGASIQPGAVLSRLDPNSLRAIRLADASVRRTSLLASLSDDELSPAGLAARVVMTALARRLAQDGSWAGATALVT